MHLNLIPTKSDKLAGLFLKPWRLISTLVVSLVAIAICITVYFGYSAYSLFSPEYTRLYSDTGFNQITDQFCKSSLSQFQGSPFIRQNLSNGFDAGQYTGSTPALNNMQSLSNLRVIAISTKGSDAPKPMCKWTLFSAALNKIPLELYGSSEFFQKGLLVNKGKPDEGLASKRDCTLSVLCAAAASSMNDAVLMIDAYDIIFQRPFEELQYLYYKRWNAPEFVVSAEENCYPSEVDGVCGDVTTRPRVPPGGSSFVNSGVLIGKPEAFIDAIGLTGKFRDMGIYNDQAALAKVVYENYKTRPFMLDHLSELSSAAYPPKPLYKEVEIGGRTYFVDATSKGIPMMIHLNGGIPKERATNLWYMDGEKLRDDLKEEVQNYPIFLEDKLVTVGELCPDYF
ncbi:hypothetical protein CcCBS67573_g08923 [Chytriomyces confervae]|uniref:PLOD1-3-like GT domain-containing protein n=1 Tax=Chytriomyces confervae TaxID=246404 RepID=A0A507EDH6_9FUNG|nr:hypothetical protein CcCBS67573_g08923 [Chytriomyces confervae]